MNDEFEVCYHESVPSFSSVVYIIIMTAVVVFRVDGSLEPNVRELVTHARHHCRAGVLVGPRGLACRRLPSSGVLCSSTCVFYSIHHCIIGLCVPAVQCLLPFVFFRVTARLYTT